MLLYYQLFNKLKQVLKYNINNFQNLLIIKKNIK